MERSADCKFGNHSNRWWNFYKIEGSFSGVNAGYPQENISNFKKFVLRLSGAYRVPRNLEKTLSLRNLKRNLSPNLRPWERPWKRSFEIMIMFQVVKVVLSVVASSKTSLIFWKNIVKISSVFADFRTIGRLDAWWFLIGSFWLWN